MIALAATPRRRRSLALPSPDVIQKPAANDDEPTKPVTPEVAKEAPPPKLPKEDGLKQNKRKSQAPVAVEA